MNCQFHMQVGNNKEMTECGLKRKKRLDCMDCQGYGVLISGVKGGGCVPWLLWKLASYNMGENQIFKCGRGMVKGIPHRWMGGSI